MSAIDSIGAQTGTTANTGSKSTVNAMDEAQSRFLKLLTTQMQNQDPLNPLDNAQVTTQMAQINTVSGIAKLNESIGALSKSLMAGQAMQASSVVGRQVLSAGDALVLQNGAANAGVNLKGDADKVTVTIRNPNGDIVSTQDLGAHAAGILQLNWDGKDASGVASPDGNYTFSVEATLDDKKIDATAMAFARVNSVLLADDGVKLDLGKSGVVAMTDIKQIR